MFAINFPIILILMVLFVSLLTLTLAAMESKGYNFGLRRYSDGIIK